ncbi:MAG: ribonuclease III [Hyphomicrobiales bacterium]|nr:ribonuclease III [Hyphomicrobiales bacterium]MBV9752628.1 ribonuclease III [Hyphomicrobiales bacterium]
MKRGGATPEALEALIGYHFHDKQLLDLALTHVSAVAGARSRAKSYQRLEFLGDRVLGLAIASLLYREFPTADEGDLSKRLAELVRRESCAVIAESWRLGDHIRLGPGETQSGGRHNRAILGDVAEALIGAVFLDGGYEAANALVVGAVKERLRASGRPRIDPKTALQEWAQARGLATPSYAILSREGPDHSPLFRISVSVEGHELKEAVGPSKRMAEQAAAEAMLRELGAWQASAA